MDSVKKDNTLKPKLELYYDGMCGIFLHTNLKLVLSAILWATLNYTVVLIRVVYFLTKCFRDF